MVGNIWRRVALGTRMTLMKMLRSDWLSSHTRLIVRVQWLETVCDTALFVRTMRCRRVKQAKLSLLLKNDWCERDICTDLSETRFMTHVCMTRSKGVTGMFAWLPRAGDYCFVSAGFFQSPCNMNVHFVPLLHHFISICIYSQQRKILII